jgi:Mrp family chromosome partitioning ATPase/predicted Fe-Mo cluster-binding NifX family protein
MSETYETQSSCGDSCSSCQATCSSRKQEKEDFREPLNPYSKVKKVIGIVSGKGGVGKSFLTSYLSVLINREGYHTAILDADITGPSIPKAFGIHEKAKGNELGIFPAVSKSGIKIMSVNLLLETEDTPVIWRGPVIAGTVKQFWSDVLWDDVDYMFVDMPPGTGDVPLTVFQSLPVDGVIIVTSPQELVSMIVAKAVNMAEAMNVPILGIVENYSYLECGNCGEKISVFGTSHVEEIAEKYKLPILGRIPITPAIAEAVDAENIEGLNGPWLTEAVDALKSLLGEERQDKEDNGFCRIAVPTDGSNNVFAHFGKAAEFTLYEFQENELVGKTILDSKGEGHGATIEMMKREKINVVICGGIGMEAMEGLMNSGILVVPGAAGDADVSVAAYLDGGLNESSKATCACQGGNSEHNEGACNCK